MYGEKIMQCQKCDSLNIVRNGSIANGKKKFLCKECSRQFIENPERRCIADAEWSIADRLLLEKISMEKFRKIARTVLDFSLDLLQTAPASSSYLM
ncbi:transposase-like zinc-binding domain-containing protein [Candidatus Electronema sp. JM]|uniref:IS1/IS1595 family N-terminal zinc-binding domain-containing protein n=1 Tax=Candidatus Electronema sp. JM TaxID=3401571 RepID=UPI003AA9B121